MLGHKKSDEYGMFKNVISDASKNNNDYDQREICTHRYRTETFHKYYAKLGTPRVVG